MVLYTFHPFTLNQYLGTLTIFRVVPLSQHTFTAYPCFLKFTVLRHLELDKEAKDFSSYIPDPSLYNLNNLVQDLTAANFSRNQLSPSSIGFSPLIPNYTNACTQYRFRPPRCITTASPYSGLDRSASGQTQVTLGIFIPYPSQAAGYWFPFGLELSFLPLPLKYTPWPIIQNVR
jgi:hypothetical protein